MERKIGEIFEYNGEWYQCVEGGGCNCCDLLENGICVNDFSLNGSCFSHQREDETRVIFKKLEKVGEPYEFDGHIFQSYHTFEVPIFTENYATVREYGNNSKISIEIKQTKEDMEEKGQCCDNRFEIIAKAKEALLNETNIARDEQEMSVIDNILFRCWQMGWLDKYEAVRLLANDDTKYSNSENIGNNLKPFNLEAAKAGKPICTRDGRKARIICFDQKDIAPIVGLVTGLDGKESIYAFYKDGRVSSQKERVDDLMMLPEKREGWVNVYNSLGVITFSHNPYDTKEEALEELKSASGRAYCVDTIKINWEE